MKHNLPEKVSPSRTGKFERELYRAVTQLVLESDNRRKTQAEEDQAAELLFQERLHETARILVSAYSRRLVRTDFRPSVVISEERTVAGIKE